MLLCILPIQKKKRMCAILSVDIHHFVCGIKGSYIFLKQLTNDKNENEFSSSNLWPSLQKYDIENNFFPQKYIQTWDYVLLVYTSEKVKVKRKPDVKHWKGLVTVDSNLKPRKTNDVEHTTTRPTIFVKSLCKFFLSKGITNVLRGI